MRTKRNAKLFVLLLCCAMLLAFGSTSVFAGSAIDTAEIEGFTLPAVGEHPDFKVTVPEDADYYVDSYRDNLGLEWNVRWHRMEYDNESGQMVYYSLSPTDVFESGKSYTAEIGIGIIDGDTPFVQDNLHVFYGNNEFEILDNQVKYVTLYAYFYVGEVDEITVTDLEVPVAGKSPDFNVTVPDDANYYVENAVGDGWTNGMLWVDITDPENEVVLEENDVFIEDHTYQVLIGILADDGCQISSENILNATINGESAIVRYPGMGARLEFVYTAQKGYEIINNICIDDFTYPKAGQKPDFDVTVPNGEPYRVENYMGESWTNGMYWLDVTDPENEVPLGKNDTFKVGHRYEVIVSVLPNSGYTLAYTDGMSAYIDRLEAEVNGGGDFVHVRYTFYVGNINEIVITDLKTPVEGKKVDYYVSIPDNANYHLENSDGDDWINEMLWIDLDTDKTLALNDTFVKGHTYQVLIGVMPNNGYSFSSPLTATINGESVTVRYPTMGVRLEFTYVAEEAEDTNYTNPFNDVKSDDYFHEPVLWAVEKGITKGVSDNSFAPLDGCTRGQAVTFLWRAAGSPEPRSMDHPFTDVVKGAYYEKAVIWAVENKITAGTSATTFSPEANCSRSQIVTFLWRAAGEPNPGSNVKSFDDMKKGSFYEKAVLWAVRESVTSGTSATTFSPEADCTRSQIVTFLYRYMEE